MMVVMHGQMGGRVIVTVRRMSFGHDGFVETNQ